VKLQGHESTGKLLGATVVARNAGDHEVSLAMSAGIGPNVRISRAHGVSFRPLRCQPE